MTRLLLYLAMVTGVAFVSFGCSDELPPLPDSGVQEDGATHDGQPSPDRGPRDDGQPPPDVGPLPDGPGACFDNSGCNDASYCEFPQGCEGPGRCVALPDTCATVEDPVCGCDGQTYGNGCAAAASGVNVAHAGACAQSTCLGPIDCLGHEFCNLDYHCGATPSDVGSCEPTPTGCFYEYVPVCGCDNMDYNNACEAHAVGVSVLHDGTCDTDPPPDCALLENKYAQVLAQAKVCSVSPSGPEFLCDKEVMTELMCPCPTYVASANSSEVLELDALATEWANQGCAPDDVTCPGCAVPSTSYCGASTGSGARLCVDM